MVGYLVADRVHHMSRLQDEQTTLVDRDPAVGNVLLDGALGCERLPERHPLQCLSTGMGSIQNGVFPLRLLPVMATLYSCYN